MVMKKHYSLKMHFDYSFILKMRLRNTTSIKLKSMFLLSKQSKNMMKMEH